MLGIESGPSAPVIYGKGEDTRLGRRHENHFVSTHCTCCQRMCVALWMSMRLYPNVLLRKADLGGMTMMRMGWGWRWCVWMGGGMRRVCVNGRRVMAMAAHQVGWYLVNPSCISWLPAAPVTNWRRYSVLKQKIFYSNEFCVFTHVDGGVGVEVGLAGSEPVQRVGALVTVLVPWTETTNWDNRITTHRHRTNDCMSHWPLIQMSRPYLWNRGSRSARWAAAGCSQSLSSPVEQ